MKTTDSIKTSLCLAAVFFGLLARTAFPAETAGAGAKNVVVYYEPGRFAGWPANNGVWSWGNEILVGFERGFFKADESRHSIDRDKPSRTVLARSLDGGETWKLEEPETLVALETKARSSPGGIRFDDPNFAMRVDRDKFLVSYDRGHKWEGPYDLSSSFEFKLTARTDYLVNGEKDCFLFLSGEQPEIKAGSYRDRAFCARTTDGGKTFKFVSWISGEPLTVRSVMPATVRISPTELVSALRRREGRLCWIDAYGTEDGGASWKFLSKVADLDGNNGNPPSMARLADGRLCVAWGSRIQPFGLRAKVSLDQGRTWGDEILLRQDGRNWDLGYTRTVVRPDGKLVTIYYYTTDEKPEQHIAATIWEPGAAGQRARGNAQSAKLHLKVDLALPTSDSDPTPLPGTLKPGWSPFVLTRWRDMYMHDGGWQDGSRLGKPPKTDGIAGSGVHVAIDCGTSGEGGFAVYGMERNNLGGGGENRGQPQGDPIANGWFHDVDWGGENRGDVLLRINGLPAGEYEMTCYHNHWEPQKQKTRNRLDQPSKMPPMTGVRAMALPAAPLPGYEKWGLGFGTGKGVTSIKEARDVKVTSETSDDKVATSVVRFKTDGSNDVLVIIDGGDNTYPDPARKGREGAKGILNAFKLDQVN